MHFILLFCHDKNQTDAVMDGIRNDNTVRLYMCRRDFVAATVRQVMQ